jgi:LPS sulfotransferase NodH
MPPATAVTNGFDFDAMHHAIATIRRKQVFFVGGAAKSGTTWLQLLLNAHPEISCTGEGHFANKLLPGLAKTLKTHNATLESKSHSIFDGLNDQPLLTNRHTLYLATAAICLLFCPPDKVDVAPIVGDKTPDNVRHFQLLATLFPQAKFIHIVRDARDCAVSAWFHNQRVSPEPFSKHFPSFPEFTGAFAKAWVLNVSLGAKFAAQQPERCLTIRYEDLSRDPLALFTQVCGFLGASTDPGVLQACCAAADFASLSGGRSRGQEDRGSFFRQGLPGDWRGHFDASADLAFRAKVEPWISTFRYL